MVEHMVWIRFKPGVSEARQREHLDGLRSLKGRVPGIERIAVGENFTDRAQGYTHGLLVTLTDRAALQTYADHPEHVAVAGPLREDADLLAMDIEHDGA
ncbi:MAG: Dabb family protein [Phycisphaeraceae bacterium]